MKPTQTCTGGRVYGLTDRLLMALDGALKGAAPRTRTGAHNPGVDVPLPELSPAERRSSAAMMRVNHTGEVCAQALYRAQAAWSTDPVVRGMLEHAADEEAAHLAWCAERLEELDSRPSRLDPLWFGGAYAIGSGFAVLGDEWSMGFLDETERQVVDRAVALAAEVLDPRHRGHEPRVPAGEARGIQEDPGRRRLTGQGLCQGTKLREPGRSVPRSRHPKPHLPGTIAFQFKLCR